MPIYEKFVPADQTPSLSRRIAKPLAKRLFADLNRRLELVLAGTDLRTDERDSFLGGVYSVTIARSSNTE